MEQLYKGKSSPLFQALVFLVLGVITVVSIFIIRPQPFEIWVIFQVLLFAFSTVACIIGAFTRNDPKFYYPAVIVIFIVYFILAQLISKGISHATVLDRDIAAVKPFIVLNILFLFIFMTVSVIFRIAKSKIDSL